MVKGRGSVKSVGQGVNTSHGPPINVLVEGQGPFEPVPNNTRAAGLGGWAEKGRGHTPSERS